MIVAPNDKSESQRRLELGQRRGRRRKRTTLSSSELDYDDDDDEATARFSSFSQFVQHLWLYFGGDIGGTATIDALTSQEEDEDEDEEVVGHNHPISSDQFTLVFFCWSWKLQPPQQPASLLSSSYDEAQDTLLTKSSSTSSDNDDNNIGCCVRDSILFFSRLQTAVWIIGFELGILVQGSTLGFQEWILIYLSHHHNHRQRLVWLVASSLLWSYLMAMVALGLLFVCYSHIRLFLRELCMLQMEIDFDNTTTDGMPVVDENHTLVDDDINDPKQDMEAQTLLVVDSDEKAHHRHHYHTNQINEHPFRDFSEHDHNNNNNNNTQHYDRHHHHQQQQQQQQPSSSLSPFLQLLDEHTIDIQCQVVKGTVVGIVVAWMGVHKFVGFATIRVIYGGTVFLLALSVFMLQVWYKHPHPHQHQHNYHQYHGHSPKLLHQRDRDHDQ